MISDQNKIDRLVDHIAEVRRHCIRMGEQLIAQGEAELGRRLIANGHVHDFSKWSGIEWEYLWSENEDKDAFKLAWQQHVTTNPHHPQCWGKKGIHGMPDIFVAEMVSDWKSRSNEFSKDLMEWINNEATVKYGFNKKQAIYKTIMRFVGMICDAPFRKVA